LSACPPYETPHPDAAGEEGAGRGEGRGGGGGGQADNQWYLDLIAPQGSNVQVRCGDGTTVGLTYQSWGRFTWSSTGGRACANPRVAIVNGKSCSISNAVSDSAEEELPIFEDSEFDVRQQAVADNSDSLSSSSSGSGSTPSWAVALIVVLAIIFVALIIIAIILAKFVSY